MDGDVFTVKAKHIGKLKPKIDKNRIDDTQFLEILSVKVGARVMLIHNIMTTDGLTNGARGEVVAVEITFYCVDD